MSYIYDALPLLATRASIRQHSSDCLDCTMQGSEQQLASLERSTKKIRIEVDDARRDEWSNEAICSLLGAYEEKWNFRNRGNLKGVDWEEVALRVSGRNGGSRTLKTPFQCKNKVASMKQKYRSEALMKGITGSSCSRWPHFTRMDVMLRSSSRDGDGTMAEELVGSAAVQVVLTDPELQEAVPKVDSGESEQEVMGEHGPYPVELLQRKLESRLDNVPQNRDNIQEDESNTLPDKRCLGQESGTNMPGSKTGPIPGRSGKRKNKLQKRLNREVADSISVFADSILKLEEAKLEMFKDSECRRAQLEAQRVDMELKRIEIIMNTQLQIARLLTGNPSKGKAGIKRFVAAPGTAATNVAVQANKQVDLVTAIHTTVLQPMLPCSVPQSITGHALANSAQPLQFTTQSKPC